MVLIFPIEYAMAQPAPSADNECLRDGSDEDDVAKAEACREARGGGPVWFPSDIHILDKPIESFKALFGEGYVFTVADVPINLSLTGRVNRAFLYGDNGKDSELFLVDNNNSSTQIIALAEARIKGGFVLGGRIKLPIIFNSSVDADFGDGGLDFSFGEFGEREIGGYLQTPTFGRFYFGYGATASDGTSQMDLSGTTVISRSRVRDLAGGLSFADGGPRVRAVFTNYDGLGDNRRIRWDSPRFRRVVVSLSTTDDGEADVALRWESNTEERRWRAAGAVARLEDDTEQISLSASALWDSGFSVTLAAAGQSRNDRDPVFLYGKIGWYRSFFDWGPTAFAADVAYNRAALNRGDDAFSVGLFAVQSIEREGLIRDVYLYAGLRGHYLETKRRSYDEIFATMIGFRARF